MYVCMYVWVTGLLLVVGSFATQVASNTWTEIRTEMETLREKKLKTEPDTGDFRTYILTYTHTYILHTYIHKS